MTTSDASADASDAVAPPPKLTCSETNRITLASNLQSVQGIRRVWMVMRPDPNNPSQPRAHAFVPTYPSVGANMMTLKLLGVRFELNGSTSSLTYLPNLPSTVSPSTQVLDIRGYPGGILMLTADEGSSFIDAWRLADKDQSQWLRMPLTIAATASAWLKGGMPCRPSGLAVALDASGEDIFAVVPYREATQGNCVKPGAPHIFSIHLKNNAVVGEASVDAPNTSPQPTNFEASGDNIVAAGGSVVAMLAPNFDSANGPMLGASAGLFAFDANTATLSGAGFVKTKSSSSVAYPMGLMPSATPSNVDVAFVGGDFGSVQPDLGYFVGTRAFASLAKLTPETELAKTGVKAADILADHPAVHARAFNSPTPSEWILAMGSAQDQGGPIRGGTSLFGWSANGELVIDHRSSTAPLYPSDSVVATDVDFASAPFGVSASFVAALVARDATQNAYNLQASLLGCKNK